MAEHYQIGLNLDVAEFIIPSDEEIDLMILISDIAADADPSEIAIAARRQLIIGFIGISMTAALGALGIALLLL